MMLSISKKNIIKYIILYDAVCQSCVDQAVSYSKNRVRTWSWMAYTSCNDMVDCPFGKSVLDGLYQL